jgi:hypothetical protein
MMKNIELIMINFNIISDDIREAKMYLTSGSNIKCKSDFKWCASNVQFYSGITWGEGLPSLITNERCVHIFLNTGPVNGSVLSDYPCADSIPFICEVYS